MNKKFSTLLMGGLLLAGAVSAQTPIERSATNTQTPSPKFYYQIVNGNNADGKSGYALQAAVHTNGKDSVKLANLATLQTQLTGNAEEAIEAMAILDSTLWSFTPNGAENLGYYSIENKATGKKLQFAKEGNAIIAAGLNAWFVEAHANGNDVYLKSYVINADNSKTAYSINSDRAAGGAVTIGKTATAGYKLVRPGHIYMTADLLNAEGDGNSFKMAIEGLTDEKNPLVKNLKAYDVTFAADMPGVLLRSVDDKIKKHDEEKFTGDAKYTKDVFVAVDTTMHTFNGGIDINGIDAFGYKYTVDSATVTYNDNKIKDKVTAFTAAPKRAVNNRNYGFAIYKDVTLVGEDDQLLIKLLGVPTYDKTATDTQFAGETQVSYVSWAGFAEKGDELTTARLSKATTEYVYKLPVITLAAGAKADITPGVYYIKYVAGKELKDKYAYSSLSVDASNKSLTYSPTEDKNMNNDLLAKTQYVVTGANGKYTITNRESAVVNNIFSGRIYVKGDHFVKGNTEFTLEAVPAEVAADNHVGYKFFSKEEVGNVAVALKFNSKIGSAYIVAPKEAKKDKEFSIAGGENVEEAWFKVVPVDTADFGVEMERAAYVLKDQFNDLYLAISDNDPSKLTWKDNEKQATFVTFRSTGKEGEYQIIYVPSATTPDKADAAKFYKQLTVRASEAEFYLAEINDEKSQNGFWTIETPAAPDYLTIEDAPAHKRIFSSENSSLAISMGAKRTGILKAVADKGDYIEDQFKMWIDTACVENAEKPLYYINTCAGLDEETREKGHMMYMVASDPKFNNNISQVEFREGYVFGADSLAIAIYKNNSIEKFENKKDMSKNPAAFAFQMTPTEGEYVVENIATKSYLRQVNGVLYLTKIKSDALAFGIESVDTPTANEGVAVSEVTVIAGEGQVTIAGAAGKKVVISNILGQTVSNTVITSDNAVIAAPQGVVVVAVEGEEAVKAIVK